MYLEKGSLVRFRSFGVQLGGGGTVGLGTLGGIRVGCSSLEFLVVFFTFFTVLLLLFRLLPVFLTEFIKALSGSNLRTNYLLNMLHSH